eukprot:SAG31_NODE_321_length_17733_cov_41.320177_7_plen_271_part_00
MHISGYRSCTIYILSSNKEMRGARDRSPPGARPRRGRGITLLQSVSDIRSSAPQFKLRQPPAAARGGRRQAEAVVPSTGRHKTAPTHLARGLGHRPPALLLYQRHRTSCTTDNGGGCSGWQFHLCAGARLAVENEHDPGASRCDAFWSCGIERGNPRLAPWPHFRKLEHRKPESQRVRGCFCCVDALPLFFEEETAHCKCTNRGSAPTGAVWRCCAAALVSLRRCRCHRRATAAAGRSSLFYKHLLVCASNDKPGAVCARKGWMLCGEPV